MHHPFVQGISVCIPRYHTNQISFTPTKMMKSQPANMIFQPRGDVEFPKHNATVRIVAGYNYGCMGVWDGSARIALESPVLKVQDDWRQRPAGFPITMDEGCSSGLCSPRLPYNLEPWMVSAPLGTSWSHRFVYSFASLMPGSCAIPPAVTRAIPPAVTLLVRLAVGRSGKESSSMKGG